MNPFARIVVASDFGESSGRALELGIEMAERYGSELVIVHSLELLIPPYPIALMPEPGAVEAAALVRLDRVVERAQSVVPSARGVLLRGSPVDQILAFVAKSSVDLLIVGTHVRRGPARWFFGHVSDKIVRNSVVPVLTVQETAVSPRRIAERARA